MEDFVKILGAFFTIYWFCILGWVLISWLPMFSPKLAYDTNVLRVRKFLDSVVLPWVRLFRFIPPLRMGAMMLDMSALVAIFAFTIGSGLLLNVLTELARG